MTHSPDDSNGSGQKTDDAKTDESSEKVLITEFFDIDNLHSDGYLDPQTPPVISLDLVNIMHDLRREMLDLLKRRGKYSKLRL